MKSSVLLIVFLCFCIVPLSAQNSVFGKNKLQYKNFQWEYIQSDHFDIYFSQDGYDVSQFTAFAAEAAYTSISKLLKYEINKRISIIVYNSHNEFQQTNVISEYLDEGIGGVTELFKNRVVVPFEGNYSLFRHVIHHELVHAVLNDMFYGGTIQSLISNRAPVQLPAWLNEGFAEYASMGWETNSDMFMRDAVIHNHLPPIESLEGYFAYRGGQSVWRYISDTYGEQKIAEIFGRMKMLRSVEMGFRSSIGLSIKDLSERWQKKERVYYWPDIAKREEPSEFSFVRLTDHKKEGNFYNTSPALSPQGDRIAFLSDRDDYFDIFLMSASAGTIIKKLVSGQRTKNFEELHLLTPGLAWSPDGKNIALAVKAGERDAIMIIDVESGKQQKLQFDLDGISSVEWSPDGKHLVFTGMKTPQSDIYLYTITTGVLKNLTRDLFTDSEPIFSPDGKFIYFVSDRGDFTSSLKVPEHFAIDTFAYGHSDIYSLELATNNMQRITDHSSSSQTSPRLSPDGRTLLFLSDKNGINNIYSMDLQTGKEFPLTNSISGLYQLSLSADGTKLAFSSLTESGFDIFLMIYPFEKRMSVSELEPTDYIKMKLGLPREEMPKTIFSQPLQSDTGAARDTIGIDKDTLVQDHSRSSLHTSGNSSADFSGQKKICDMALQAGLSKQFASFENKDSDGNYISHKYKLNFSPDLIYGGANYTTFYGLEGTTVLAFSDMLGDHQIILQASLMIDLKNSDYGISYLYLPDRIDYGVQAFHSARFLYDYNTLYRYSTYGMTFSASYPFDRYNRIDGSIMWLNLLREDLTGSSAEQYRSLFMPIFSYVNDNSLWQENWFAPNNGSRFNAVFYGTPKLSSRGLDIQTGTADYRSYNKLMKDLIFAYRLSGGASIGGNRQNFFIGGTEGWINNRFKNDSIPVVNVEDYAFLTPVLPLRGYEYNAENGSYFAVANMELRFPLIRSLVFGGLPIGFSNILGTTFVDIGSAWTNSQSWKGFGSDTSGATVTKDLLIGTGFGIRMGILGLPLRFDVAWKFQWSKFSDPSYYISLGADY